METMIYEGMAGFYYVSIWRNGWVQVSKHRFKSDALTIEALIKQGANRIIIKSELTKLNQIALNQYVGEYFINF